MANTHSDSEFSNEFLNFTELPRFNVVQIDDEQRNTFSAIYLDPNNMMESDRKFYDHFTKQNEKSHVELIDKILQRLDVNYQIPEGSFVKLQKPEYVGYSLLHFAVKSSCIKDIKYLLNRGADFTLKGSDGFTPLRLAIKQSFGSSIHASFHVKGTLKHPEADAILDAHAKTGNSTNPKCNDGISHLHIACMTNHFGAVALFLEGGADANDKVKSESLFLSGYTPLHFAARYCSVECMKELLDHGADRNAKCAKGRTPLHVLMKFKLAIIQMLRVKSYKEDSWLHVDLRKINAAIDLLSSHVQNYSQPIDDTGLTKFHLMCITTDEIDIPNREVTNVAISHESPIWPGYTPLHFAARCSVENFIDIANNGANVAAKDAYDMTPLFICTKYQHSDDVFLVFSSCETLRNIRFTDGKRLVEVMSHLLTENSFWSFLTSKLKKEGTQIRMDSPVWPGYTVLHLAVAFTSEFDRRWYWDFYSKIDYSQALESSGLKSKGGGVNDRRSVDFGKMLDAILKNDDAKMLIADANGDSPLHLACYLQDEKLAQAILKHANKNLTNLVSPRNLSHLHVAIWAKDVESVKRLLASDVDLNTHVQCSYKFAVKDRHSEDDSVSLTSGLTPLQVSMCRRDSKISELLLEHGADPLMKSLSGLTPLLYALSLSNKEYVNLLLSDPRVIQDNDNFECKVSNFHAACYANNLDVVRHYLAMGVDINQPLIYDETSSKLFGHFERFAGCTPLHIAVKYEYVELVRLLVEGGADIDAKEANGLTPLDTIMRMIFSRTWYDGITLPETMKAILDCLFAKLSSERDCDFKDNLGLTLLHVACGRLDVEAVKRLIDSGADVNAQLSKDSPIFPGFTPMHFVVCLRKTYEDVMNIVELLLKSGADVTLQSGKNTTPLHIAYNNTYEGPVMDSMLQSQTDYAKNLTDNNGLSHFHIACTGSHAGVVEKFIKNGSDVDKRTYYYWDREGSCPPLYFAITRERGEVFDMLLKHGANTSVRKDKNGTTLVMYASKVPRTDDAIHILETLLRLNPEAVNVENRHNYSPLYSLMMAIRNKCFDHRDQRGLTPRDFKAVELLMSAGARVNVYKRHEGLLGSIFNFLYNFYPDIFMRMVSKATDLNSIDSVTGGNAIHNLMSTHTDRQLGIADENAFADGVGELMLRGCELDHQNFEGHTPLHSATLHTVQPGVAGLLMQGADVNVIDKEGKTALEHCDEKHDWRHEPRNELIWHTCKMKLVHIHVSDANKSMCDKFYEEAKSSFKRDWTEESCIEELERMKKIQIFNKLTLRQILTEDFVVRYPTMGQMKRASVKCFVGDSKALHRDYVHFAGLLRLQYRKALARMRLMGYAKTVLHFITDYAFPDCCIEIIAQFLSYNDLKVLNQFR